ncbi:hypothetical protein [Borreliella americana]|nr:hypothetical protein [Borreliella americana]
MKKDGKISATAIVFRGLTKSGKLADTVNDGAKSTKSNIDG